MFQGWGFPAPPLRVRSLVAPLGSSECLVLLANQRLLVFEDSNWQVRQVCTCSTYVHIHPQPSLLIHTAAQPASHTHPHRGGGAYPLPGRG